MITLKEIRGYAEEGYQTVPIIKSYIADEITTITALKKMKAAYDHVFMLESAVSDQKTGRYTFIGMNPILEVTASNGKVSVFEKGQRVEKRQETVEETLREILAEYRSPRLEGAPHFTGGLVGYFTYEFFQYLENRLDFSVENVDHLPDVDLMLFDKIICYDHYKHQILIISHMSLKESLEEEYLKSLEKIDQIYRLLMQGHSDIKTKGKMTGQLKTRFSREEFVERVEKAQNYIQKGEVSQVVLSNYLSAPFQGSLLDSYRALRTINPSPYMIYLSSPHLEIAGASPETLGTLENGQVKTYPLAGTRPRGRSAEEDVVMQENLLNDEKEVAEHKMLVDIGRRDLAEVCDAESICVEDYMSIHKYSHVMHIGSCVAGNLAEGKDALDIIQSLLPAGTLSGYPKLRACQIIQELEADRRDVYGGAIGYIDLSGNMDTCIAIRLIVKRQDQIFIRSGAGIVEQSNSDSEYQECINKAEATVSAVEKQKHI